MENYSADALNDGMEASVFPIPTIPKTAYRENIVITPNNASTFTANGEQIAKFLTTSGGYLDPGSVNFRYRVAITSANGAIIPGAPVYAFWQSLRTYCQNIAPDNITKYNQICGFLLPNLTQSTADKSGVQSLYGYSGTPNTQELYDSRTCTLNEVFYVGGPLICSLSMAQTPIPLFKTGPIQIELQLNTIGQIFTNAVVPTAISITNLEISYDVIHYPQEYIAQLPSVFKIPTFTFENSSQLLSAGAGNVDVNFNMTAMSAKSIFLCCENTANDPNKSNSAWDPTLTTGEVQIFINSKPFPNRAISTLTNQISPLQYLREAAKSFYNLHDDFGHSKSLSISDDEYKKGLGIGGAPTATVPAKTIYGLLLDREVHDNKFFQSGVEIGADMIKLRIQGTRADPYNLSLTLFKNELIVIDSQTRMLQVWK